jgi:DNA (cytosine-5)-methyltransferase 1
MYRLLDAFCGAGGCTKGYQRAGFYVVGVDIEPQPHYCGDEFIQADALEYIAQHGTEFDAIHASPPCQRYSVCTPTAYKDNHPDLIGVTRSALLTTGKPYVIENVENARSLLVNPLKLCGSMFGLNLWRHRYFELNGLWMMSPASCDHSFIPVLLSGSPRRNGNRAEPSARQRRDAADLQWMTRREMDEAIPPAYTEFIGAHLMRVFEAQRGPA